MSQHLNEQLLPALDAACEHEDGTWSNQRGDLTRTIFNTMFRAGFGLDMELSESVLDKFIVDFQEVFDNLLSYLLISKLHPSVVPLLNRLAASSRMAPALSAVQARVEKWVTDYRSMKRQGKYNDTNVWYIDAAMAQVDAGELPMEQALADVLAGFLAGTHTTSTNVEQILMHAARSGKWQQRVYDALVDEFVEADDVVTKRAQRVPVLKAFVYESLRLNETVQHTLPRCLRKPIELGGYQLPVGTVIIGNVYAIQRDERVFGPDAGEFRPGRWLTDDGMFDTKMSEKLVVFGNGKRSCPGRSLAEKQLLLVTAHLFRRFEFAPRSGHGPEDIPVIEMTEFNRRMSYLLRVTRRV